MYRRCEQYTLQNKHHLYLTSSTIVPWYCMLRKCDTYAFCGNVFQWSLFYRDIQTCHLYTLACRCLRFDKAKNNKDTETKGEKLVNIRLISWRRYFNWKDLCLKMLRTWIKKWWALLFPLSCVKFLYLSEDINSHHSLPSIPLVAARFIEKHKWLPTHSKVQSKTS